MQDNETPGFRIGMEEEPADNLAHPMNQRLTGKRDALKLDRVSRRLTWITFLMPCLMLLLLILNYRFMEKRISDIQTHGLTDVQQLADSLKNDLNALGKQYEEMRQKAVEKEEPLNEAFLEFEKITAAIRERMDGLENKLIGIDKAKADQTAFDVYNQKLKDLKSEQIQPLADTVGRQGETLQRIDQSINPLEADVQEVKKLQEEQMTVLRQSIEGVEERGLSEIAGLSAAQKGMTQDLIALTDAVGKIKQDVVEALNLVNKTISEAGSSPDQTKQLSAVLRQITQTERELKSQQDATAVLNSRIQLMERELKNLKQRAALGTPKRGEILEQDLQ